jgi:hypothetical protein
MLQCSKNRLHWRRHRLDLTHAAAQQRFGDWRMLKTGQLAGMNKVIFDGLMGVGLNTSRGQLRKSAR